MKLGDRFYNILTIALIILGLSFFAAFTIYYDPMFHYHAPFDGMSYVLELDEERYISSGIAKNFDYDSIICGSSVNENFKTTQFDKLFNAKSIKVPLSGGYMKEVASILDAGFKTHKNIKYVLRSLDTFFLLDVKTEENPDAIDVKYLVNDNIFDDVYYLFNFDTFIGKTLRNRTLTKNKASSTTFDDYANWSKSVTYGAVPYDAKELNTVPPQLDLFDYEVETIKKNIENNILRIVREHRDTQFLLYYVPYSVIYYLTMRQTYSLKRFFDCEKMAFDMLVDEPNVKLYGFSLDFDRACNISNYKDSAHYGDWVNEKILDDISKYKNRITRSNSDFYFKKIYDFYYNYRIK